MSVAPLTDDAAIARLAGRLEGAPFIGLDTEFLRERTYRPQLCLLQVAVPGEIQCVDPIAASTLAPLQPAMIGAGIPKVMHAARQDLEVLLLTGGNVPAPDFDTQVAASLLGFPPQAGYAELVARQLGHSIDKAQTRTDWSRRPLTPAQLAYAADDVHHLLQLHADFTAALDAQGRIEWLREDCAALEDPALYRTEPADAWRRLKGLGRLRPREQAVARALAAWREQRAIASDKPRGWILTDDALYALATLAPVSTADLEKIPALPPAVIRNRGEELLALIGSARNADDDSSAVPTPQRLTPEQTRLIGRLQQQVRDVATELGISPEVLATRRDIEALALGSRGSSSLLKGWRRGVIGEQLLALLA